MRLINPAIGGVRPRGVFDPAITDYQPGDAAVEAGLPYVCTAAPVAASPQVRHDDFTRADDGVDWHMASDGHAWVHSGDSSRAWAIASDAGTVTPADSGPGERAVLGPPLALADVELLVGWSLASATGSGLFLLLRAADDFSSFASLRIGYDGQAGPYIVGPGGPDDQNPNFSWTPPVAGTLLWTRFRATGAHYAWRTWAQTAEEPALWDGEYTTAVDVGPGHVGVIAYPLAALNMLTVTAFTATTLAAVLPVPSADPDHWALTSGTLVQSAGLGWELSDLDDNGADIVVPIAQDMVLVALDVDIALYINALPEVPGKAEVLFTISLGAGTPSFVEGSAAYNVLPASPHFGATVSVNPNELTSNYDPSPVQGSLCRMILKSWVPADGAASQAARHATIPLQVAASAGDALVFHLDHLGVPLNCEVQVCLQYVPSGG